MKFADLSDAFATVAEDYPVCPHCGYIHDGIDPSEWAEDGKYDCFECEKTFQCSPDYSVSYSTVKI